MSLFSKKIDFGLIANDYAANSKGADYGSLVKGIVSGVIPGAGAVWTFAESLSSPDASQHWTAENWPWWAEMDQATNPAHNFLGFFQKNQDFFDTIPWETSPGNGIMRTPESKVKKMRERMQGAGLSSEFDRAIDIVYPNGFDLSGNRAAPSLLMNVLPPSVRKAGFSWKVIGIVLIIAAAITAAIKFFKPKKRGFRRYAVIGFVLASSFLHAQVSNNAVKQKRVDWNAVLGVTSILNKPNLATYSIKNQIGSNMTPQSAKFSIIDTIQTSGVAKFGYINMVTSFNSDGIFVNNTSPYVGRGLVAIGTYCGVFGQSYDPNGSGVTAANNSSTAPAGVSQNQGGGIIHSFRNTAEVASVTGVGGYIGTSLNVGAGSVTGGVGSFGGTVTSTGFNLSALNVAPVTSTSTGTTGEIRFVNGFIYLCVSANTWQRASLVTF